MKLSIITINLNNIIGLKKTIDSIVAQTFNDFEWIVIDGGSTDGSKDLIEKYSKYFSYWVSEPDKGIYNAMNKGIDIAKGEYIQFVNSGDWLFDETTLDRCMMYEVNADVLYGDSMFVFENHVERYSYPFPLKLSDLYYGFLGHASSFIKSSLIKEEKYNENYKIVSDWEFWIKVALNNRTFYHIDECVSYFNTEGISSTNDRLRAVERACVIKEFIPSILIEDFKYTKYIEQKLEDNQVKGVMYFGRKSNLYHKLITACLEVIHFIDKILKKR